MLYTMIKGLCLGLDGTIAQLSEEDRVWPQTHVECYESKLFKCKPVITRN